MSSMLSSAAPSAANILQGQSSAGGPLSNSFLQSAASAGQSGSPMSPEVVTALQTSGVSPGPAKPKVDNMVNLLKALQTFSTNPRQNPATTSAPNAISSQSAPTFAQLPEFFNLIYNKGGR